MFASFDGIEMYYEVAGEGEALLLIHGLGYDGTMWELQNPLSRRHMMVTMDLRGHGRSTKSCEKYSIEIFARDLHSLLEHLGIGNAHVLGISMGGCVALRLALLFPESVGSLLLINTFAKMEVRGIRDALKMFSRKYLLPLFSAERLARMSARRLFEEGTALHQMAYSKFLENDRRCYIEASRTTFSFDCLKELGHITAPTLIIAGRNDRVVSPRHARTLAMGIPNSHLVILEGGHALPIENPRKFNKTLVDFLGTSPRAMRTTLL